MPSWSTGRARRRSSLAQLSQRKTSLRESQSSLWVQFWQRGAFSAAQPAGSAGAFAVLTRFVITPLFLFGGVFYPVSQLPAWLRPVAYATPLYHGVELCRGAVLGTLGVAAAVVHVSVLVAFWLAGFLACRVTFARRLAT